MCVCVCVCVCVREREREREREKRSLYIWMVMCSQVKVGGEFNGFWEYGEYGGPCLGNRCVGRADAYGMSQILEVLMTTHRL